jgi:hypothetical protein
VVNSTPFPARPPALPGLPGPEPTPGLRAYRNSKPSNSIQNVKTDALTLTDGAYQAPSLHVLLKAGVQQRPEAVAKTKWYTTARDVTLTWTWLEGRRTGRCPMAQGAGPNNWNPYKKSLPI